MGSHALLCSCLRRAAMLGSRSKVLFSSPLPVAGEFLGAFVTLSAPFHPPFHRAVCPGTSRQG